MVSTSSSRIWGSDPRFLTHHALRIKGFSKSESLADIVSLAVDHVEHHLSALAESGHALFREARALWQLTPEGRDAHRHVLAEDVKNLAIQELASHYGSFLEVNEQFKTLCGDWQLRNGAPNDHADPAYDGRVISHLVDLNDRAQPIVSAMAEVVPRLTPYMARLESACRRVVDGEHKAFTGVMCGSFHDIWMELHEDLILTQGIDRATEGSF